MRKWIKSVNTKQSGITLVALVVTIVILIILATISIGLIINGGLLSKTEIGTQLHEKEKAKEKLNLVLGTAGIDKATNRDYNQDKYLNNLIEKEIPNVSIIGDIIVVEEYGFQIDRSVPKIIDELGKVNKNIKIVATITETDNDTKAKIKVQITSPEGVSEITINGETVTIPNAVNGVYTVEITVTENNIYKIGVKDNNGGYQTEKIEVNNLSWNMEIWNKADMEKFRDLVNEGKSFIGRTVNVMDDIDLQGNSNNMWTPIGLEEAKVFKGTFEGNKHKISNLYYSGSQYKHLGLFGGNFGTIQNIIMEGVSVYNTYCSDADSYTGAIAGANLGTITNCGVNSGTISAYHSANKGTEANWNDTSVGGVAGLLTKGRISTCYNKATINGQSIKQNLNYTNAGGIVGLVWPESGNSIIENCYNTGSIKGTGLNGYVGGIVGEQTKLSSSGYQASLYNAYSIGSVTANFTEIGSAAGIAGANSDYTRPYQGTISNCYYNTKAEYAYGYWTSTGTPQTAVGNRIDDATLKTYTSKLGNAFTEDKTNINGGFPILKWQINEED